MKSVVGPAIVALVLAAIGAAFWIAGQTDRRLADVHTQLATLQYTAATAGSDDVEEAMGMVRRVPAVGRAAVVDLRDVRATADYWRGGYAAIAPAHDANGTVTEADPEILLLSANAAFRASQTDADRSATLRRIDVVIKSYADVLKNSPGHVDAAYNYEYAIRVRETLARARTAPASKASAALRQAKTALEPASDLPSGPTVHGRPGGPPPATDMSQFKIVIPKRGEERKDNPEAGKGGVKVRRG
jgi:hypothetical protein